MGNCVVCKVETTEIRPAPYAPYSRYVCKCCGDAKRINYKELVMAFSGALVEDEALGPYLVRFKSPTLEYFNKTKEEFFQDVRLYKDGKLIFTEL